MSEWSFLTNHARVLVSIAHDPGVRLHDIAATVGITERRADPILTDLTAAAYVVKDKDTDGRRNRYQIQNPPPATRSHGPRTNHRRGSWTYSSTATPPNRPAEHLRVGWARSTLACHQAATGAMTAKNVFAPKRPANLFHQTSVRPGKRESRSRKCTAP